MCCAMCCLGGSTIKYCVMRCPRSGSTITHCVMCCPERLSIESGWVENVLISSDLLTQFPHVTKSGYIVEPESVRKQYRFCSGDNFTASLNIPLNFLDGNHNDPDCIYMEYARGFEKVRWTVVGTILFLICKTSHDLTTDIASTSALLMTLEY